MSEIDDLRAENEKLRNRLKELDKRQSQTMNGMIQICASCKKVHEDNDAWIQIEEFIREHADVQFTHGLCPDCHKKLEAE